MLTADEIEDILRNGRETRRLEVKGPGPRGDKQLFAKVTRAALGMGNLRDGGFVIIGLDDKRLAEFAPGLSDEELNSWLDVDSVSRKFGEYANPPLRFELEPITLTDGARVIQIHVEEFPDIPHLCARDFGEDLRRGALYVRPRKVTETSEVADLVDMRDVIELATAKRLREFVGLADSAGLRLEDSGSTPSDDDAFAAERDRSWG